MRLTKRGWLVLALVAGVTAYYVGVIYADWLM